MEKQTLKQTGSLAAVFARTALVLPFSLGDAHTAPHNWAHALLRRRVPSGRHGHTRLWVECDSLPVEVGELAPGFRTAVGWQDPWLIPPSSEVSGGGQYDQNLQPQSLRVTNAAKDLLFSNTHILCLDTTLVPPGNQAQERNGGLTLRVGILDIKAIIYPLGLGLLVVELDWLPEESKDTIQLDTLCSWIHLSRLCHESERQMGGWSFGLPRGDDEETTVEEGEEHQEKEAFGVSSSSTEKDFLENGGFSVLGPLGVALREGRQLPLAMLGDWLLHLPDELPSAPPARIHRKRCHHHTAIVTNTQPDSQALKAHLFRLRRGLPATHRPPTRDVEEGWDEVLSGYKENLSIGLSREGTCFILWPTEEDPLPSLASGDWPRLAHGVYLLLAQQVHAERWALAVLDALALQQGSTILSHSSGSLEELERHRIQLKDLASMMMLYTLSMSHDDCGGCFEHAHFFHKLRMVLGVPSAKEEVRKSIGDILSFVESEYQEEEKKLRRRELAERRRDRETKREQERLKDLKKKGWEVAMVMISVAVLPVLMISGYFGMNLEGIPAFSWWEVVFFTTGLSVLLLGTLASILLVAFRSSHRPIRIGGGDDQEDQSSSSSSRTSWLTQGMDFAKRSLDFGARRSYENEGGRAQNMAANQQPPHPAPVGPLVRKNGSEQSALLRWQETYPNYFTASNNKRGSYR